jgi:hypothetical protein
MSDVLERCEVCHAMFDEEDLFCANCGTEVPDRAQVEDLPQAESSALVSTNNFECRGCGASMSYDASAQTLRCPFCGSEQLDERQDVKTISPQRVLPFAIHRDRAMTTLRGWLQAGFWRPGDLSSTAIVTKMAAVYVPYWVFSARIAAYWTADSSQTPMGARGNWFPLAGHHQGTYHGLLVGASGALTPAETSALCPFDLAAGVPPDQVDLKNAVFEPFRVQRKYARPLARHGFEELVRTDCAQYVSGQYRNLKVNLRLSNLTSQAVLVPVWIMAYRYQDQVYRFLINGQTGKATGAAPTSWRKVLAAVAVGIVLVVIAALVVGALAR